jgi:hypothetical protein
MHGPVLPEYVFSIFYVVKTVFIVIDAVLLVGFVYAFIRAWHYHPNFKGDYAHGGKKGDHGKRTPTLHDIILRERWRAIQAKFALGTAESARLAIIEADALVDTALRGMQIPGEHLADRLSNLDPDDTKTINRIWRAHRLRNDLVHTPGFAVSPPDAQRTMDDYEAFLKEMEVIE